MTIHFSISRIWHELFSNCGHTVYCHFNVANITFENIVVLEESLEESYRMHLCCG